MRALGRMKEKKSSAMLARRASSGAEEVRSAAIAALVDIDESSGTELLVAEQDGQVVGTCQLITFRQLQHRGGWCAEIESMHVAPERRGTGIGGLLLEAAVDAARAAGCYRVQLTSNAARADAHRIYERQGFTGSHVGFKRLLESPG